jgi:hypothetical protein
MVGLLHPVFRYFVPSPPGFVRRRHPETSELGSFVRGSATFPRGCWRCPMALPVCLQVELPCLEYGSALRFHEPSSEDSSSVDRSLAASLRLGSPSSEDSGSPRRSSATSPRRGVPSSEDSSIPRQGLAAHSRLCHTNARMASPFLRAVDHPGRRYDSTHGSVALSKRSHHTRRRGGFADDVATDQWLLVCCRTGR